MIMFDAIRKSRARKWLGLGCAAAGLLLAAGCGQSGSESGDSEMGYGDRGERITMAKVILAPTTGNYVSGSLTISEADDGVHIVGRIENLEPGPHGFHVHEFGDCSAPDGTSAGGHFNPTGMPHGGPDDAKRHVGDLGNIEANANGVADIHLHDDLISLNGENSIIGKAIIVHAGEDDLTTQPTGAAGVRVACGVIEAAGG